MSERNAELYAAVLADPDDDAPRLVYADWLSERGDPWGELIAVQIARTRADTPELEARESTLLYQLPQELLPRQSYRRGFVEILSVHCDDLEARLPDSCVRDLRVFGGTKIVDGRIPHEAGAKTAAALPRMRLRALSLTTTDDQDLATLLQALDGSLDRFSYGLPWAGTLTEHVVAITRSRLRVSSLTLLGISPDALASLAAWHPLRSLAIQESRIGPGVFASFVDAPAFVRLEHLDLTQTHVGEEDVFAIASSELPLRSLDLSGNLLGPAVARRIAETPRFASLGSLGLVRCGIEREGLEALVESPYLRRDMQLCLDGATLGMSSDSGFLPGTAEWCGDVPDHFAKRFDVIVGDRPD